MRKKQKLINHIGLKLGLHTVEKFLGMEGSSGRQLYLCRDIFGNESIFNSKRFNSKNIGQHLRNKQSIKLNALLYSVHQQMIKRCYDPRCDNYKNYGKRNIKITEEWLGLEGYVNFRGWALDAGWKKGLTIDRINIHGNYEPSNCRFITREENARYKTNTRLSFEIADQIRREFGNVMIAETKKQFCDRFGKKHKVSSGAITAVLTNRTWIN